LPIVEKAYNYLKEVDDANEAAIFYAKLLEDDEIFNAGTCSRVQQDGQIRMSASIIDSQKQKFAGVINIQNIKNKIEVAN
ncbi:isoaspartyl peptidase/L-asparaginase, partial [Francisella tularensis subsp. holarctica]|uniref:isoaspartyl peptidase/L-asparaginase n=1 Tax=Francisella tularensis TaxID=263 RepID=UPI002381CB3A